MTVRHSLAILTMISIAACGSDGGQTPRPVEVLYYVSGGTGLQFGFAATADPDACGTNTTGIQAPNGDHQFGDRVFNTPHLFVLENLRQPVRAAFQNLDLLPISVDLYFGAAPQASVIINPGECRTVAQTGQFPPNPPPPPARTPTPVTFPTPNARGPEVRIEVCSPTSGLLTSCVDGDPDRFIAFFASLGDISASNITNCQLPMILDACRSPATFFLEQPQDQVDAVMSVNPGQNPGGQPTAEVRAELYVCSPTEPREPCDTRVDSAAGTDPVVSQNL